MIKKHYYDFLLVCGIILVALIIILVLNMGKTVDKMKALIWYEDEIVETIELKGENSQELRIDFNNQDYIIIEYRQNAIRVIYSPCNNKNCVNQSWSSTLNKPIICMDLHYKIVLESDENPYDVVIG